MIGPYETMMIVGIPSLIAIALVGVAIWIWKS